MGRVLGNTLYPFFYPTHYPDQKSADPFRVFATITPLDKQNNTRGVTWHYLRACKR